MIHGLGKGCLALGVVLTLSLGCGEKDEGTPAVGGAGHAPGGAAGSSSGAPQAGAGAASGGAPATGGAGGAAGAVAGGGSSAAGSSPGGGSGIDLIATSCSPSRMAPDLGADCANYTFEGSGISDERFAKVEWMPLRQAFSAGTKTAFSNIHLGDSVTVEVWGTTSSCGPGVQKLLSVEATADRPYCVEFTPNESFSEILYVTRGAIQNHSSGYFNPQFCVAGRCP